MEEGEVFLPAEVDHGCNAYNNYGCRCEKCVKAWREYQMPRWRRRKATGLTDPNDKRHGTYSGYANYGCREPRCREANRIYSIGVKVRNGRTTEKQARTLGWVPEHERSGK